MLGSGWALMALAVAGGQRAPLGQQHRVAGAGRPRRRGHGELGLLARGHDHVGAGLAPGRREEAVDGRGALVGIVALQDGGLEAVGPGGLVADPDHLRVLGQVRAGGLEPLERVLGHGGQLVAVGDQDRRADRARGQHRGGHARLPVVLVHQHDGGGPVGVGGRGEDRAGHAGGVRGGVGATDADGVLGGRRGEAELGRGLLVVGLGAQLGRAVVLAAEAAAGEPG